MGNIGSGFGVPAARCGFEDGYFPVHAPLGFPNCANYKGTPEQREADLRRRGYGTDIINAWRKYYAENPSDPLKIDYTKVGLGVINNSMSKEAALAEQALIKNQKGTHESTGSWVQRLAHSRAYNANIIEKNITIRTKAIEAVLSNPVNIKRWFLEEQAIIDIENKKLAAIEAEKLAIIKKNELADLESQRLIEFELQKQRDIDEYVRQQNELVELQRIEDDIIQAQNLLEVEKQIEVDKQNKNKIIATVLLIGGIGLGLFVLSKRKSFK
jgi:hypothetical protein